VLLTILPFPYIFICFNAIVSINNSRSSLSVPLTILPIPYIFISISPSKRGFEKKPPYKKIDIFRELKGCENSPLERRKRDTGTVTSKARIKFASNNWDIFGGDINKLRDSLKEFTFYYFQLNEVFSFKDSSGGIICPEKELYGDLTSLIEEYLLIKYSTKCNSGCNGLTKISEIKITDIQNNINDFVDFLSR